MFSRDFVNKVNNHKTLYYKGHIEKDVALAECKCQHFIIGRKNIMYFIILKCIREYMLCFKMYKGIYASQMYPEKKCAIFGILAKLDARLPCGILENWQIQIGTIELRISQLMDKLHTLL